MKRYITHKGTRYLIRGNWTAADLHRLYKSFLQKYPGTKTTFLQFLRRGFIYFAVGKTR